jgi:apolipoprotein N-acyltransferase
MCKNMSEQIESFKLKKIQYLSVFISACLTSLAFSVFSLDWFIWFSLTPFFYILFKYKITPKSGFFISLFWGLTFYLGTLTWMFRLYPLTWMNLTKLQSIVIIGGGWFLFSFIEALGLGFVGFFTRLLEPVGYKRLLVPTCLWIIIEWFQGIGGWGFTWGRLANSQFQNLPLIQSVNLFGTLFVSALIIFVNLSLALTILEYKKEPENQKNFTEIQKFLFTNKYILTALLLFSLNLIYGFYTLNTKTDQGTGVKMAIIQGNIASDQKWKPGSLENMLKTYLDLSYEAAKEKVSFIVWPETAIPVPIRDVRVHFILSEYKKITSITNAYLIAGTFDDKVNPDGSRISYNSMMAMSPKGEILGFYYKRHLVPFGEYLPFKNIIKAISPALAGINQAKSEISPGTDPEIVATPFGNIGGFICFESIIPQIIRSSVNEKAELLVVITNDSWFKDSTGVYQHNGQSVLRAVESDRYVVRAANTGISSFISPKGEILKSLPPLEKGYLTGEVKFRNNITLYTRIGDIIVPFAFIMLLGIFIFQKKKDDL